MSQRQPLASDQLDDTIPVPAPLEQPEEVVAVAERERNPRRRDAQWTARAIRFAFGVIEIAIGLRLLLKLIAANEASGFARFIYGFTAIFVAPFQNVVNSPRASNGATFEFSSLLAILIYLLLSWLLVRLFFLLLDRPSLDE